MKRFLCAAALIFAPVQAFALSAGDLYEYCFGSRKDADADNSCSAYFHGFVDGMATIDDANASDVRMCLPNGIEIDKAHVIVKKYLENHPDGHDKDAGLVAGAAFIEAFRCPIK